MPHQPVYQQKRNHYPSSRTLPFSRILSDSALFFSPLAASVVLSLHSKGKPVKFRNQNCAATVICGDDRFAHVPAMLILCICFFKEPQNQSLSIQFAMLKFKVCSLGKSCTIWQIILHYPGSFLHSLILISCSAI